MHLNHSQKGRPCRAHPAPWPPLTAATAASACDKPRSSPRRAPVPKTAPTSYGAQETCSPLVLAPARNQRDQPGHDALRCEVRTDRHRRSSLLRVTHWVKSSQRDVAASRTCLRCSHAFQVISPPVGPRPQRRGDGDSISRRDHSSPHVATPPLNAKAPACRRGPGTSGDVGRVFRRKPSGDGRRSERRRTLRPGRGVRHQPRGREPGP